MSGDATFYREKLFELANPFRDQCGQFTSVENDGGECGRAPGGGVVRRGKERFYVKTRADGKFQVKDRLRSFNEEPQQDVPRLVKGDRADAEAKAAQMNQRFGAAKEWQQVKDLIPDKPAGGPPMPVPDPPAPRAGGVRHDDSPLARARELEVKILGGGVNPSYVLKAEVDGVETKLVYKPLKGQRDDIGRRMINYRDGTITDREEAAYLVDRALGLNLVPETAQGDFSKGKGSVQRFVKGTVANLAAPGEWDRVPKDDWYRMHVLDSVLGNQDRHAGNFLFADGKLVAIDHGYTFTHLERPHLRTLGKIPKDSEISAEVKADLVNRLKTTNWADVTRGRIKGESLKALKTKAERVARYIEQDKLMKGVDEGFMVSSRNFDRLGI